MDERSLESLVAVLSSGDLKRLYCALSEVPRLDPEITTITMHLAQNTTQANGVTGYGKNVIEELKKEEHIEHAAVQRLTDEQDHVLKSFRLLIADLCQQFNGGHPGYALQCVQGGNSLIAQQRCDRYGCDRCSSLEIRYAVRATYTDVFQS